jgi:hypothetical protein
MFTSGGLIQSAPEACSLFQVSVALPRIVVLFVAVSVPAGDVVAHGGVGDLGVVLVGETLPDARLGAARSRHCDHCREAVHRTRC